MSLNPLMITTAFKTGGSSAVVQAISKQEIVTKLTGEPFLTALPTKHVYTPTSTISTTVPVPTLTPNPLKIIENKTPIGMVADWFTLLTGSKEQKIGAVLPYIPANITPTSLPTTPTKTTTDLTQYWLDVINKQKQGSPDTASYWTTPTLGTSDISTPQVTDILSGLKDMGKWVLIGGACLIGLYLITRNKK
jgi:hypothetical protein